MRLLFLALLLVAPALASASEPTNAELAARIAGLEARVALLEGGLPPAPQTQAAGAKALELNNWRKCVSGMSKDEIRELLGKPTTEQFASAVNQYSDMDTWIYGSPNAGPGGSVLFMGEKVAQCATFGFPS